MKSEKPLTCVFSSPPSWEGMRTLCEGCRAIWRCAAVRAKDDEKVAADPYRRGNNIVHKTWPKQVRDEDIIMWKYSAVCGAKIPKKDPYAHSATQWKFVTCPECLKMRKR